MTERPATADAVMPSLERLPGVFLSDALRPVFEPGADASWRRRTDGRFHSIPRWVDTIRIARRPEVAATLPATPATLVAVDWIHVLGTDGAEALERIFVLLARSFPSGTWRLLGRHGSLPGETPADRYGFGDPGLRAALLAVVARHFTAFFDPLTLELRNYDLGVDQQLEAFAGNGIADRNADYTVNLRA